MALRVAAHSLTLRTFALFAVFNRTAYFTLGFAALDLALGAAKLLHVRGNNELNLRKDWSENLV